MSRYIDADELIFFGFDNPDCDNLFEFVPKEFIDNAPTADVPQWILCCERLPKYDEEVLCFTTSEEMVVGHLEDEWGQNVWTTGEFASGTFDALAWMPLPEPWKGEADEQIH